MNSRARSTSARGGALSVALATAVAAALVIAYLALGGGSYEPLEVADPCKPRRTAPARGLEEVSQQILLSALDGAACRLRVPREELALALADEGSRERFAREHRVSEEALEGAIRAGLERAVADAERAGRLSPAQALLLRSAVRALPMTTLIQAFRTGSVLAGVLGDLFGR